MPPPKIVLIGAGSASFGANSLATLLQQPVLRGSTIGLVDLDPAALQVMERVARRLNEAWEAGMTIQADTDRQLVLPGADFVVISVEVPPREALWRLDWEIPIKHGLRQPYGENGGPGGMFHACRQIPPFMAIVRDMERLCPDAWLINYSNPLPRLNRAVTKYSSIRVVGKCHQIDVGYGLVSVLLSGQLGIEVPEEVNFYSAPANLAMKRRLAAAGRSQVQLKAVGINHFTWIADVVERATGRDLYPALREALRSGAFPASLDPLTIELFRIFDVCPVPGDSHLCEYLACTHDPLARPWERYQLRLYDWSGNEAYREEKRRLVAAIGAGQESVDTLKDVHSEGAAELIAALVSGDEFVDESVNIPNQGAIPELPPEAIVELPARIKAGAFHPLPTSPLPFPVLELCRREAALVEMVVDTAVTGRRDLALQTLLLDPMINDIDRARRILDDYLTTFVATLPQFQ